MARARPARPRARSAAGRSGSTPGLKGRDATLDTDVSLLNAARPARSACSQIAARVRMSPFAPRSMAARPRPALRRCRVHRPTAVPSTWSICDSRRDLDAPCAGVQRAYVATPAACPEQRCVDRLDRFHVPRRRHPDGASPSRPCTASGGPAGGEDSARLRIRRHEAVRRARRQRRFRSDDGPRRRRLARWPAVAATAFAAAPAAIGFSAAPAMTQIRAGRGRDRGSERGRRR